MSGNLYAVGNIRSTSGMPSESATPGKYIMMSVASDTPRVWWNNDNGLWQVDASNGSMRWLWTNNVGGSVVPMSVTPGGSLSVTKNISGGGTLAMGGAAQLQYNKFGTGASPHAAMATSGDVYISQDLDVDGIAYLASGTAWIQEDIAEMINTKQSRENKLCGGNVNCLKNNTKDNLDYGDLVCIDPTDSRVIMKCTEENSRLAVGFISNTTALYMGNNGYPVALAGIVFAHVTNKSGNVNPGDLLVSASIPGYAMKNDNPRDGTVVGKAFDFCDKEECTIPVFVALS